MKILFLAPYIPYPPHNGGKLRILEIVRRLATRHAVTLAAVAASEEELASIPLLEDLGIQVLAVRRRPVEQSARAKVTRLLDPQPRIQREWHASELQRLIDQAVRENPPDIINCENIHVAPYALPYADMPRLLVMHDIAHVLLDAIASRRPTRITRLVGRLDALKARRYERQMWQRFTACATMSETDRRLLLKLAPQVSVHIIPNGVDTSVFQPAQTPRPLATLIMTGDLGYYPNMTGLQWFMREVWPTIRAGEPAGTAQIVGPLTEEVRQVIGQPPGVVFTGRVPDVRPYVAQSTVFIVPIHIGSGTRLKLLEAMAQGMPIVSTSIGAEGLDVVDGEHLLIADTPAQFAAATLRLLGDESLRQRLGERARQFVVERYDWEQIVTHLENVYHQVIQQAGHAPAEVTAAMLGGQA